MMIGVEYLGQNNYLIYKIGSNNITDMIHKVSNYDICCTIFDSMYKLKVEIYSIYLLKKNMYICVCVCVCVCIHMIFHDSCNKFERMISLKGLFLSSIYFIKQSVPLKSEYILEACMPYTSNYIQESIQ